jgi:hypothetical protein
VAQLFKRTVTAGVGLVAVFLLSIAFSLRLIPQPHGRLQYMVAGAVATAITLAATFGALNWLDSKRRDSVSQVRIRVARRSGESS